MSMLVAASQYGTGQTIVTLAVIALFAFMFWLESRS